MTTTEDVIRAASSVARDIADGSLSPTDLERQAVAELRELVGTVVGPDDSAWPLQCDITRQVLALDGVPADELAEWLAVARHRAGEAGEPPTPTSLVPEPVSLVSVADNEECGAAEPEPVPDAESEPEPESGPQLVPTLPRPDHYDPMTGWQPGHIRRS